MSYYRYHMFFCTHSREDGHGCCQDSDAQAMRDYAKVQSMELGIAGAGQVHVSTSGCMNRCDEGPVIVIYPDGVWYRYADKTDIDEIIKQHLVKGQVVERLRI